MTTTIVRQGRVLTISVTTKRGHYTAFIGTSGHRNS